MEKEEVLNKLIQTRDNLLTLKPEEFAYDSLVSEYDNETSCGTVCCAVGWYPKWYPESGFFWKRYAYGIALEHKRGSSDISKYLMDFHGISENLVQTLFYGSNFKPLDIESLWSYEMEQYTLEELVERFNKVIEFIQNSEDESAWVN